MVGNINKLVSFSFIFLLLSCSVKENVKKNVYVRIINNNISYNSDVIDYYIVNKSNEDIKILCNSDFFKREKDSLFINTWFQPKIKIYNGKKLIQPVVLNVNYKFKTLDSLSKIKKKYVEISNFNRVNFSQLDFLKKYIKIIKKNDSIKLSTKINFEDEPRFYDLSEIEGYILDKNKKYELKLCLNERLNFRIQKKLNKNKIYTENICSNPIKITITKSHYSELRYSTQHTIINICFY